MLTSVSTAWVGLVMEDLAQGRWTNYLAYLIFSWLGWI